MLRLLIWLSLVTTCLGNVNVKPLPGMPFVNRAHRLGRGLVAWWVCNERSGGQVFDLSGNGNTGTRNGTGIIWTAGKFGSAQQFNGSDDYINIPNRPIFTCANAITVLAWIKTSVGASPGDDYYVIVKKRRGSSDSWQLLLHNGGDFINWGIDTGDNTTLLSTTDVTDDVWHQAVGTWDGTNISVYVDGILENTGAKAGTMAATEHNVGIGWMDTALVGTYDYFNGLIDHVMIYNRALIPAEIFLLHQLRKQLT